MSGREVPTCTCLVCRIQRALAEIDAAHDEWLDRDTDLEMGLRHLDAVVAAVLAEPWWRMPFQRERLRRALSAASPIYVRGAKHSGSHRRRRMRRRRGPQALYESVLDSTARPWPRSTNNKET